MNGPGVSRGERLERIAGGRNEQLLALEDVPETLCLRRVADHERHARAGLRQSRMRVASAAKPSPRAQACRAQLERKPRRHALGASADEFAVERRAAPRGDSVRERAQAVARNSVALRNSSFAGGWKRRSSSAIAPCCTTLCQASSPARSTAASSSNATSVPFGRYAASGAISTRYGASVSAPAAPRARRRSPRVWWRSSRDHLELARGPRCVGAGPARTRRSPGTPRRAGPARPPARRGGAASAGRRCGSTRRRRRAAQAHRIGESGDVDVDQPAHGAGLAAVLDQRTPPVAPVGEAGADLVQVELVALHDVTARARECGGRHHALLGPPRRADDDRIPVLAQVVQRLDALRSPGSATPARTATRPTPA